MDIETRVVAFVRALLPHRVGTVAADGSMAVDLNGRSVRLGALQAQALVRGGVLISDGATCTASAETRSWLRRQKPSDNAFGDQHRELVGSGEGARANLNESPLARLAMAGANGEEPFLAAHQVEAGERVRRLFERAQMQPRLTMSYDPTRVAATGAGSGGAAEMGDHAPDARKKLDGLAKALPSDCFGVVIDVCGLLKGLQLVETERGWPRRSAKVVLRIGLEQAARHFGLSANAVGAPSRGVAAWGEHATSWE